ncbi:MAG: AAA family ATPase [Defluviitaleaceae bacterium]|nr:AAA family ATPase [Defluviitaleaceae bacterium]
MKLIIITGPGAVGKMTVGQELAKVTDLRLFHGHMLIEPVLEIFGDFHVPALLAADKAILREFVKTDHFGLIITIMWNFDSPAYWNIVSHIIDIFKQADGEIYIVELNADQDTRLTRNTTENRLAHKASKRDLEWSSERIKFEDATRRMESRDGEVPYKNHMKINNAFLEPDAVAKMIKEEFLL